MDGNKDDALKCLKIAQRAFQEGYKEKSLKFVHKSIRLYPTKQAQDLLVRLTKDSPGKRSNNHSESNGSSQSYGTFSKPGERNGNFAREENSLHQEYTQEQNDAVKRVNKNKDYYEILGVEKDASDVDLKKAYRKLALQLHPDKNKAPGATDAFKAVGTAFGILSDKDKRHNYDLYGPEESSSNVRTRYRRSSNMRQDYDDIDPDEIFHMFFGGGFPSGNVRVFRRGNTFYQYNNRSSGNQQRQENGGVAAWLQFLPLLMLLLLTLFSNLIVQENPYSLYVKGDYQYKRLTDNLKVPFYVKHNFNSEYKGGDLRRLERRIEDDFVEYLRSSCYQERVNKENMRRKGVYFSSKDFLERAEKMATPSCERLEKLFRDQ